MKQYLDLVNFVMQHGLRKENRTGVDTISHFGYTYRQDLANGFPLLTTKHISWSNIILENLWFLSGDPSIDFLRHYNVKFWDPWADEKGLVPSAYGNLWRAHPVHIDRFTPIFAIGADNFGDPPEHVKALSFVDFNDQIKWVLAELHRNPNTRRAVVSAWAPGQAQSSKLPPCHISFILNVQTENRLVGDSEDVEGVQRLNLLMLQRSCDTALGVPYNLAGYAFLLSLFSHLLGFEPGTFVHTLGDVHIYTSKPDGSMAEYDHMPGLRLQLSREPRKLPKLTISDRVRSLADIEQIIREKLPIKELLELFKLEGYDPHEKIAFKVAV